MKTILVAFFAGVVFALGVGIGGMTQPAKVIGFLDFFGAWDPSLAFVMVGAIGVHSLAYSIMRRRSAPLLSSTFSVPTTTDIDFRLVLGATIFGLGWGLAGYCPAPALTSLASGSWSPAIFSVAMLAGMIVYRSTEGSRTDDLEAKPQGHTA